MAFATTIHLSVCIAFADKFGNRMWNSCVGWVSTTPFAAGFICLFFSNVLNLTLWIPEAKVVAKRLC